MARWGAAQRELHLNACLDAAAARRVECPTCGEELTHCDEHQRSQHVNRCLDRAEAEEKQAALAVQSVDEEEDDDDEMQTQVAQLTQVQEVELTLDAEDEPDGYDSERECGYVCKICGADMTEIDLTRRIRHVKQCGQKFGVRPGDMAEVEQAETIAARLENKAEGRSAPNAFAVMMQSSWGKAPPAASIGMAT
ncbi:unnamed protein product [Phytophthora fragariaefolia]|uniref:Unnamed protein product n=1 Tax=Phytophthora fragariaefolia TaxID=1490495 RepID=A0A9W6WSB4_9STRA|nr:unnamed protein product [Phytophthora fragariaefolia]